MNVLDARIVGNSRPRIERTPTGSDAASSQDVIDLAYACGLELDEWQQHVLRRSLGERPDGKWSAFDVGVVVARQNGKGAILMARELAGALLFGERKIVHTAHELDTARDHMTKLFDLVQMSPWLAAQLPPEGFKWGRGYEEAKFANGAVIRFKSRTRKGGRGLTGDLVVFDEAFELDADTVGAVMPLLRSRPNPQVWYASSVVDQMSMPNSTVLTEMRIRARSEDSGRLAYFEWSNPSDLVEGLSAGRLHSVISDPEVWAAANPALGIRIDPEQVATEVDAMPLRQFLVECLSVGDWPSLVEVDGEGGPLPMSLWSSLTDDSSEPDGPVVLAVAVAPGRSWTSIAAAGWRTDGKVHVELVDRRQSVGWAVGAVVDLVARNAVSAVVVDGRSDLEQPLAAAGLQQDMLQITNPQDVQAGMARLLDQAQTDGLRHLGQAEVDTAVDQAKTRKLGGGLAWAAPTGMEVTALEAVTAACGHLIGAGRIVNTGPFVVFG